MAWFAEFTGCFCRLDDAWWCNQKLNGRCAWQEKPIQLSYAELKRWEPQEMSQLNLPLNQFLRIFKDFQGSSRILRDFDRFSMDSWRIFWMPRMPSAIQFRSPVAFKQHHDMLRGCISSLSLSVKALLHAKSDLPRHGKLWVPSSLKHPEAPIENCEVTTSKKKGRGHYRHYVSFFYMNGLINIHLCKFFWCEIAGILGVKFYSRRGGSFFK